jgi:hypothetical protein
VFGRAINALGDSAVEAAAEPLRLGFLSGGFVAVSERGAI